MVHPVRTSAFVLGLLVSAVLPGCIHGPDGPVSTEVRQPRSTEGGTAVAGSFSRIDMRGSIDVLVREGPTTGVQVTGAENARAGVETRVEGDTLIIDYKEPGCVGVCIHVGPSDDAKVTVDLPLFRAATLEGSGDLTVEAGGAHPEVDFDVRGSGDVRFRGAADVMRCMIEGSGDVTLRGAGKRLEARIHGSGDLRAREFPVEGGAYEIDGSGDIATILEGGELTAAIRGSGDLVYGGEARATHIEVSGSGTVRQMRSRD
jgi:hypothetical protein